MDTKLDKIKIVKMKIASDLTNVEKYKKELSERKEGTTNHWRTSMNLKFKEYSLQYHIEELSKLESE